ncbi:MAG: 5'/3'-nucleotidase SurE [Candidatus Cloacimonetes bacterium]|nr:5'/3'-nucleotidase SurE [Candidatus Cloacimonadota bacterium]
MRILLCNDDGVLAPGLRALHRVLAERHTVIVCAPATECSAKSNCLTLHQPLKLEKHLIGDAVFHGLGGYPADAAKFGLQVLCKDHPPDLVVSGINNGLNTGQNVFYSGTVAAATEGTFAGIPAIALSMDASKEFLFDDAAEIALQIVEKRAELPLPAEILLNVNIPRLPASQIKGWKVSRMGVARFSESFTRRPSPDGGVWYWVDGSKDYHDPEPEHDDFQVHTGWVTISPLRMDLTAPDWTSALQGWNLTP